MVNPVDANTQDSQPMILANGTIVDTYNNNGPDFAANDLDARRSLDGGVTWGAEVLITHNMGFGPSDVRCCLSAGTIDAATGRMYAAWEAAGPGAEDPVLLSSSSDGLTWTEAVGISHGDAPGVQEVNVAVAADRGQVFVTYGTRTGAANNGGFVQQKLSTSHDGGVTFDSPQALGPVSALQWAAQAGGIFPGDYIGAAVSGSWLYLVWCVSSPPPTSETFHQVLWSATLRY
jgi:hypothetical protein